MKRKHIVAGNWKMNTDYSSGRDLATDIVDQLQPSEVVVVLCPPNIQLKNIYNITKDVSNLFVGAQNCHEAGSGAYTGEVSAPMLQSVGVEYVILGHSERRTLFGEDDALLARKVVAVLEAGLRPIFCVGESLDIRKKGDHLTHVTAQVEKGLFHLDAGAFGQVVIAYEPVWAIGTGETATPEQAQEIHQAIRELIGKKYGAEAAALTSILYGGSVKPGNAAELFGKPDVDGGLIGGASLNASDFIAIVTAARRENP